MDMRCPNRELIDVQVGLHDPLLGGTSNEETVFRGNFLHLCKKLRVRREISTRTEWLLHGNGKGKVLTRVICQEVSGWTV